MAGTVRGIEVLSVGIHRGNPYTEADLDDIERNFKDFCKGKDSLVKIPTVIGHEEDQPLLQGEPLPINNTGIPKVGTVTNLYKEGPFTCRFCKGKKTIKLSDRTTSCPVCRGSGKQTLLLADLKDVPKSIATLINARAYDKVSSEVYPEDQLPEGVPAIGKMFRRLALLGGELPQIKSLSDLPMADYREEQYGEMSYKGPPVVIKFSESFGDSYHCFSEVIKMADRSQMMSMLGSYGMSDSMCGTMSDEMLSECIKVVSHAEKLSEDKISKMSEDEALAEINKLGAKRFGEKFKAFAEYPHDDSDKYNKEEEKDHKDNLDHLQKLENETYPNTKGTNEGVEDMDKQYSEKKDDEKEKDEEYSEEEKEKMKKDKEKYAEEEKKKKDKEEYSEDDEDDDEEDEKSKKKEKKVEKHSERKASAMSIEKFAELEPHINALVTKLVNGTLEKVKPVENRIDRLEKNTREKLIHEFCEKHSLTGQISGAEMDTTSGLPTLEQRLLQLDDIKPIHKFGEKQLTQLDIEMETIRRRPKPNFQEKIPVDPVLQAKVSDTVTAAVERFCEENLDKLAKFETTKEEILKAWKAGSNQDRAEMIRGFDRKAYHSFCESGYLQPVRERD